MWYSGDDRVALANVSKLINRRVAAEETSTNLSGAVVSDPLVYGERAPAPGRCPIEI